MGPGRKCLTRVEWANFFVAWFGLGHPSDRSGWVGSTFCGSGRV